MRAPLSWFTDVLRQGDPAWSATAEEVDAGFVRVGFEIEDVEPFPEITGPLVVGRVESIEELTEFKKPIRFCQVDVGEEQPRGIVCGARNFAEGDLIVAALPGVVLPGPFEIASRKTYGKVSDGMICSVAEMGIGADASGILVLAPGTAQPGADAREVLGLADTAIDINVTPDRGYAFSVRGLGRELAGSFGVPFVDPGADRPALADDGSRDAWPVVIEPDSSATRYTARVIAGVDAAAVSPWWMQKRLLVAGIRPISAIVDITNYVMIELGQPLHAFDADKVTGTVTVRSAAPGEKLTTLDGAERALDPEDVVIADESGPIALAGVMGGSTTEVSTDTTAVLLESATFDQVRVFRTGKRHKLTSEASKRFERIVDPEITVAASDRAAELIVQIAGGVIASPLAGVRVDTEPVTPITIAADEPDRVAGISYEPGTTAKRLTEVGCAVTGTDPLSVTPASWRPDLRQRADLVEEVLRLEGLELIPAIPPKAPAGTGLTAAQRRRRGIGRVLAVDGFTEVLPYPFMPAGVFDLWGLAPDAERRRTVKVLNPLERDRPELNTTLLPGLLEMTTRNIARGQRDLALFTIGQVVIAGDNVTAVDALDVTRRPDDAEIAALDASLPHQPLHVAGVLTGLIDPAGPWGPGRVADYLDAFEAARTVAGAAGVEIELTAADVAPWHPGRCAAVIVDGKTVGHAGELHPAILERAGLPKRLCAFEIDIDALPLTTVLPSPKVSVFPAVLQDLAVVVDASVPSADVAAALRDGAGDLLESLELFDVFTGDQVGEGNKSLAFALRFRAGDRTLTEDEANAAKLAAVDAAGSRVGARLR
ncbi:phenylalanine--tRNA ligase subunit beta [Gordonia amarae]|uniref:Phenylalanine--tRNA ligase beta subunit n=2 Tax=Gordonia amarae TaxID=36821 RepID=G7GSJ7_9ACTN|nr:phenylalanine--tRNA ligase subunit beta [Gordonia amarae]MCS3879417.1 phenylalanyl-tRNA synthetase beta chain [Gordonia amarae]QHN17894.1 phenylalanine--tRNA ligase subunit beta [Gordonia amarae]QHN22416.1 phenylalanine--tRNA ligase subunit beta [Gordonia amarae]QHN31292.1 phenylalanine--tRNA ligase subunit beta [Gordonia amarae]QHN40037.1 phenylalanine--tRNA ligase subunit beta [Gordonia amarae]